MSDITIPLSPGVQELVRDAEECQAQRKHEALGLNHWLEALLSSNKELAARISSGLDANARLQSTNVSLDSGDFGEPFTLDEVTRECAALAKEQGKSKVYESDLAAVILKRIGVTVQIGEQYVIPTVPAS